GFVVADKQARLMALLLKQRNGKINDDFFPNGKLLGELISKAFRQVPATLFQSRFGKGVGAVLSNVRNDRTRLTYRHLRDFVALFATHNTQLPCELRLALENNYFYDPIVSIEPLDDSVTMYDITVEGEHSFVAGAGFVCHNSQGSEYPAAIILMANQHYMMLQRNLLYTALTRAKKMAVIIGSKYALKTAINNRLVSPRFTRLAERLQNLVESLSSRRQLSLLDGGGGSGLTNRDLSHPPLPGRLL
ncbi:MAG: ATP-binding domain-containing protein, partial [Fibrella sp.]|nr:ATP-binding domain-containing protein [Armatimonadota bacterium]